MSASIGLITIRGRQLFGYWSIHVDEYQDRVGIIDSEDVLSEPLGKSFGVATRRKETNTVSHSILLKPVLAMIQRPIFEACMGRWRSTNVAIHGDVIIDSPDRFSHLPNVSPICLTDKNVSKNGRYGGPQPLS